LITDPLELEDFITLTKVTKTIIRIIDDLSKLEEWTKNLQVSNIKIKNKNNQLPEK
jgi:hypothetical protein